MEGKLQAIDAHVHLTRHYAADGLRNSWVPSEADPRFHRNWEEADLRAALGEERAEDAPFEVTGAVFVECSNEPAAEEARWALRMVDDPGSLIVGVVAHLPAQRGPEAVREALAALRDEDGKLPHGLKGGRVVFMMAENQAADACLAPEFLAGLAVLRDEGLLWEMCCEPYMAPHLAACCAQLPDMTFVIDHLAHNGNGPGGDLATWGAAMDALGRLPNVVAKLGAIEQWGVAEPEAYLDRALAAFGFSRVLYESNWFVPAALGRPYWATARAVLAACARAGATRSDLSAVLCGNAGRVYRLPPASAAPAAHHHT